MLIFVLLLNFKPKCKGRISTNLVYLGLFSVLQFNELFQYFALLSLQNEQLKKEQQDHIKTLLKQAKENEKEVEQITVVKQEEVEKALANKIQIMRELIVEQDGKLTFLSACIYVIHCPYYQNKL